MAETNRESGRAAPRRVLYCACAYSEIIPAATRRRVLAALSASGADFVAVPDLCMLAAEKSATLREWAARGDVAVVACFPRAVRWLFHAGGAALRPDTAVYNMRTTDPAAIVAALGLPDGAGADADAAAPPRDGDWVPWFPAIDYGRCVNCKQCLNFCVFTVYALDPDGRVRVANPANCKNNCPACARICPTKAIIFAKCPDAPINGDEPAPADASGQPAAGAASEEDEMAALIERRRARAAAFRKARSAAPAAQENP